MNLERGNEVSELKKQIPHNSFFRKSFSPPTIVRVVREIYLEKLTRQAICAYFINRRQASRIDPPRSGQIACVVYFAIASLYTPRVSYIRRNLASLKIRKLSILGKYPTILDT